MPMMLDDEGNFTTVDWDDSKDPEMTIKNMRAFKCFFQDVMPRKDDNVQVGLQRPILADLSVSKDGHALTMSIDLSHPPRMKTTVTRLTIDGSAINITIRIKNESPLDILFNHCTFILKQNQRTIGKLYGSLSIFSGDEYEESFDGTIEHGVSGVATLKGDGCWSGSCEESWKPYAIKLFEAEVNLDKLDAGDDDTDDVVDGKDDE